MGYRPPKGSLFKGCRNIRRTFHPFFKDSTELEELENNELPSESKEPSDSKEEEEKTNKSPPAAISLEKDP